MKTYRAYHTRIHIHTCNQCFTVMNRYRPLTKHCRAVLKQCICTVQPGLKGPPVSRNAIVISRSPFLWSQNVELFSEILEKRLSYFLKYLRNLS